MSKLVTVVVPKEFTDDEEIIDYLMDRGDELYPALDLDVGQAEDNRIIVDEVSIDRIYLTRDSVSIQYTVNWSAYFGCDDANGAGEEELEISGRRVGNTFTFDEFVYPEPRSTFDEY